VILQFGFVLGFPAILRLLSPFLVAMIAAAGPESSGPEALPIKEIQRMSASPSFRESAVGVSGIVTWVDPSAGRDFYIQDETGGIQVIMRDDQSWPDVGDVVGVDGLLVRGEFAPAISQAAFRKLGRSELPETKWVSGDVLLNGAYTCERVTLDGFIRAAEMAGPNTLSVVIGSGGARITVRISNSGRLKPEELIATRMVATGVVTPVKPRGGTRQLVDVRILSTPSHCNIIEREARNPWFAPIVSAEKSFVFRPGQGRGDRIHVAGKILYRAGETMYIHDGTAGLAVRGSNVRNFRHGDWIETVGFMDIENYAPLLTDSFVQANQPGIMPIEPVERTVDELLDGLQHAAYVTVTGELIDRMNHGGLDEPILVFALRTPGGSFSAELRNDLDASKIPNYEVGSILEISGVCLMATNAIGETTGFKILVPGISQIRLVKNAGFFTIKRLLVMLIFTLGILLIVLTYAYFSSRRNMRLLAEIGERRAVAAERHRLARDLHDTLEQGLTGIQMQLHCISPALEEASAETQKRLASVRSLVFQCHNEMRQSIWDLRAPVLEEFDLGDALKRIADSLTVDSEITVKLRQQRNHVKIPQSIEDNLLRIGQEALTNAVKHANPTRLDIDLQAKPGLVTLMIRDDGSGGANLESKPGHFGLVGMKERTARIGGELTIINNPEGGCTVRIEVPLPPE
jgi:signal transduction histidine kinase